MKNPPSVLAEGFFFTRRAESTPVLGALAFNNRRVYLAQHGCRAAVRR